MGLRFAASLFALLALAGTSYGDELSELNELILQDPQNVELNLRYARLAEQQGDLRKSLSAYERVTVNSPQNQEAQQGYRRITRKLQPDTTRVTVEAGTGWDSNPERLSNGATADWLVLARLDIKDERKLGTLHWRTTANATGEFYRSRSDLDYGSVGALTGPMTDLTPVFALHSAAGAGAARFGENLLYNEAVMGFTLESGLWGGTQTGRLKVGYRRYGDFFGGSDGFYVDLSERLGFSSVFSKNDAVVATPWLRWSGIEGTPLFVPLEETQPGRYAELGLRGEYLQPITSWIIAGGSLSIAYRRYADVTILENGEPVSRRDWLLIPSASLVFVDLFRKATDLRFDYKYENNRSNVDFDSYNDHQITSSVVFRF